MTYDEIIAQFASQGKANPFQYNTDQMARDLGYSGTARTITGYGGSPSESTGMGTEAEYSLTPEYEKFLGGYSYNPATSGGRNAALDIFDQSGKMVHDDYRTGDHKGGMMKFMGAAIPALTLAGFGAGAYGLLGGGAAAAPAAGNGAFLGEAAWSPTAMAGAEAAGGALAGGADAATSAAWGNGAAGLGGDTLSAMSGGGMLGQVGGMAGEAASWMKANPMLGKALMSGGMGLLSGAGGGGGGSAQAPTYGPATQWNSPIQQGIQSAPQQMNPAPIQQRPAGLLAQGQQNDGAWRFLGGK